MADEADEKVIRDLYAAIADKAFDAISAVLDPDVVWHVPGHHSHSSTYNGKEETVALFEEFGAAVGTMELQDILGGKHYVAALVRMRQTRGPDPQESLYIHLLRISGGLIKESWHFDEDQTQLDEYLARSS